MSDTTTRRRTQAQRRAESREAVLGSAVRLFGEKGYANTSLEDIAADCGLTIRPIYHYFGNKKALFAAVNELMEQRILDSMDLGNGNREGQGMLDNWRAYLDLCDDPAFRRIVLVDSPNILGRERWETSPVSEKARSALVTEGGGRDPVAYRTALRNRVMMVALAEAALMVAESDDIPMAKREAEALIGDLSEALIGKSSAK